MVAGSGLAFAADPPPSSNQGSSDNVKFKKEVIGGNVVHRGDTVTYKSTIWVDSGVERYIQKFRDVPPAGFALVAGSPKVTYLGATNRATFTNESDGGVSAKCTGSGCNIFGNGYIVKSGQNVTLETTYRVPDTFTFGTYDSGVLLDVYAFSGNPKGANPFNVQVRVEEFATTTVLQVPSSATTGQSVTLTATVNPSNASGQVQFKDGGVNIGSPVTPVNGVASLPHSFGSAGTHSVTAEFLPGVGYFGSTSAVQNVSVTDPDVTTSLAVTVPGSATTGSSINLSATVSPSNAQGTVQFKDNGVIIGGPVAVANGEAVLPHTFTGAGAHSITAEFTGVAGFTNSTAAARNVTVTDPDVSTSLALNAPASAQTGSSVDLTASVTPANAQGSVQFSVNGSPVGGAVPVSGGSANLPYIFNAAGTFSVTAEFTGAAGFTNSSASARNVTVTDPDVSTSLSLNVPGSAEAGSSVNLSATVSPSNAQGTVQFKDNGAIIGGPVTVANGEAVLPHTFTAAGAHSITAEFTGAAGFTNSTASAQSVTVTDPDVTTSLSLNVPGSAEVGQSVDLTATVTPSTAQGTVQFTDNGAPIGSPVPVVNGVATLPHTFTGAGTHSIGAAFTGNPGFADGSATAPSEITVSNPDEQTSLSVSVPAAAETGEQVSLSAAVTPQNAQGSVQFKVNGAPVGAPQAIAGGAANLPYTFNAAGTFEVTAEFTGAAGFTNSTASAKSITVTEPVVPDTDTTTTVTVPATAVTGQQVTLSAAVSPVPSGGTVQFKVAGIDVGAPVALDGGGHASVPYTFNAAGPYSVTAEYSGAAGFAASTASTQSVTVTDPAPVDVATETLLAAPTSATTGVETTLSVTVQVQSGSATPAGSVQFRDNGADIGAPVTLVNGAASLPHTFTTAGTHQISAVYTADAGFVGSTSQLRPVVVSDPDPADVQSSVVITSTQSATAGTPFTLRAEVTGAESLPGTVQFFDGGVEIGAPVAVVNGVAELTHTFAQSGPHQIHAVYSGGPGVAGSTSPVRVLEVAPSGGDGGGTGSLGSLSGLRFGS